MMNGFAVYATWTVIASLLNFTIALVYAGDTDLKVLFTIALVYAGDTDLKVFLSSTLLEMGIYHFCELTKFLRTNKSFRALRCRS